MRRKSFFIILILIAVLLLTLVACSGKKGKTIPVPENLSVENNVLTWDAVSGATSYDIKVDDNVYTSAENKYTLPITDYEEHEISVRANTYDGTSAYSAVLNYKRRQSKTVLPQLSAPRITMTSNRVMWSTVLNNDGYKIFFDGKTILVPKNATYYDLTFTKDGRFEITMQTIGDGISYSSSTISAGYMLTVKDLKAPLQSLPKVEFTFNAEEKVLEWKNRYSADAVTYEIYRDDSSIPIEIIPADGSKARQTYSPLLTGGRVGYSMRLISVNGLYAASDFNSEIVFPIADTAPASLAVAPDVDRDGYYITWGARDYADGYVALIDDVSYPVTTPSLAVPKTLAEGRHVVYVRTSGDGIYYADSLLSAGVVFYTGAEGTMTTRLDTPKKPVGSITDGKITLTIDEVEMASSYRLTFVTTGGTFTLVTDGSIVLTETEIGSRVATEEEKTALSAVFAALPSGVALSVTAIPDNALFSESLASAETLLYTENITPIDAPEGFRYGRGGFSWTTVQGEDITYEILLDGTPYEMQNTGTLTIGEGVHVARIRRKAEHALWSEEITFRLPLDLDPPTELSLSSSVLSFHGSDDASGYILYCDGEAIASFLATESMVLLSSHIRVDGNYVISLQAISVNGVRSPMSAQIVYVKTDGAYGTESKPYVPQSAAELLSLMKENPGAYFRLVAGRVYDFSNVTVDHEDEVFDFNGVILGNNATLKGLKLHTSLFTNLDRATIRDLTIEIDASGYYATQGGILARQSKDASLVNVNMKITGNATFARSANFGMLFYSAEDTTIRSVSLNYDFSLNCGEACSFGALAYSYKGTVTDLAIGGNASIRGSVASYAGLSLMGEQTVVGYDPSLAVSIKGIQSANVAGCTTNGTATVSDMQSTAALVIDSPIILYCGVAPTNAEIANSTIGGSVEVKQGRSIELYGVARSYVTMNEVTVSSLFKGNATEEITVAGLVSESTDLPNGTFSGRIEMVGGENTEMDVAGCVFTANGNCSFRSAGTISLTGGKGRVTPGAKNADALILDNASQVILDGMDEVEVSGAARAAKGTLTVSGTMEIRATSCGNVTFGGVVNDNDQTVYLNGYRVFGSVAADIARVGGVSCNAEVVDLRALSLTIDLEIISSDLIGAGAILDANALSIPAETDLTVNIAAVGEGKVAGFAFGLGNIPLSGLSLDGSLSLKGSGSLYGVAEQAGATENITSAVSLAGEGDVTLYGLFEHVASAIALAYRGAEISIKSTDGVYYGLVQNVTSGILDGLTMSDLTFNAQPATEEESTIKVYGVTESISRISGATISGITYTIGAFDELTFGGLAHSFSDSVETGSVIYTLDSAAKAAKIGGAFLEGNGRIASMQMGGVTPLTVNSRGTTEFGGLIAEPGNVTVSRGSGYYSVTLALTTGISRVGGAFSSVALDRKVTFIDHPINIKVNRNGAGEAMIGGVISDLYGYVKGATVETDITSAVATDLIGGVAAKGNDAAMSLSDCLVKGSVNAPSCVGGLIGECTGGRIETSATVLTIRSAGTCVGGLFGIVRDATIYHTYSLARLPDQGYGFFAEGENLSIGFAYFAGEAHACSLADSAVACTTVSVFTDVSLNDLPIVRTGSLDTEYRSFSYGYNELELGSSYIADGLRYPYLSSLGYPVRNANPVVTILPAVNIVGTMSLYSDLSLPRLYDGATPSITWVDETGRLEINNGVAEVVDNGTGVLIGYIAGGARLYQVNYTASGFVPFEGEGTSESPYLIKKVKYLAHVKEYAAAKPGAYFKMDIEGDTLEGATFATIFTESAPFDGHFDFNGTTLLSPEIGPKGIFGYLNGATITGLVLKDGVYDGDLLAVSAVDSVIDGVTLTGVLTGRSSLIGALENCTVTNVTARLSCIEETTFALFESVNGGSITNISLKITVHSGESASLYLIDSAENATIDSVQVMYSIEVADVVNAALVREDSGSVFTAVMIIADAMQCDRYESEIAGFAFTVNGSSFIRSVALTGGEMSLYPLVKTGMATYTDVKVASVATLALTAGVTTMLSSEISTVLASMTGYVAGDLYTPLGFALLFDEGEDPDRTFEVDVSEITLTEPYALDRINVSGTEPLAAYVTYSYSGTGAAIVDGVLRPTAETGSGTLILANMYGESVEISVTVSFSGLVNGDGTEASPYLISTFDEFKKMSDCSDGSYFRVTGDISGTIEESMHFNGILMGSGVTVTIDLDADVLFEEATGAIRGVNDGVLNFVINKSAASDVSALFVSSASGLTVENCTFALNCPEITLDKSATIGLLFGEISGGRIEKVTLNISATEITASDGTIGFVAGNAESTVVKDLTVNGEIAITATGALAVGSFGSLTAEDETYRVILDELGEIYEDRPYVDGVTIDITITVAGGDITIGGFAAESNVEIKGVDGDLSMTLDGDECIAGGVVGSLTGTLKNVTLTGSITATAVRGDFGGVVGISEGEIRSVTSEVVVAVTTQGKGYAGGIVGSGSGHIEEVVVNADITISSSASQEEVNALLETESTYLPIVSAGGVSGYQSGLVTRAKVNVTIIRATTDYSGSTLYALAGGIAGYLRNGEDLEVLGAGTITASGGISLAGGLAATVGDVVERGVISGVTLSASRIGGAVALLSTRDVGELYDVFCAIGGAEDALVEVLTEGSSVWGGGYLCGAVTHSETETEQINEVAHLADIEEFYIAALYESFDESVWAIGGALPTLK